MICGRKRSMSMPPDRPSDPVARRPRERASTRESVTIGWKRSSKLRCLMRQEESSSSENRGRTSSSYQKKILGGARRSAVKHPEVPKFHRLGPEMPSGWHQMPKAAGSGGGRIQQGTHQLCMEMRTWPNCLGEVSQGAPQTLSSGLSISEPEVPRSWLAEPGSWRSKRHSAQ